MFNARVETVAHNQKRSGRHLAEQAQCDPEPITLTETVDTLQSQVQDLIEHIKGLEKRLSPVLRPETDALKGFAIGGRIEAPSPLMESLANVQMQVLNLTSIVSEITRRVEA